MLAAGALSLQALPSEPYTGDEHTVVLLHLDGNCRDSGGAENDGTEKGVTWVAGRFGQAGFFDGKAGITFRSSGSLHVGKNSWNIEVWIKPEKEQPTHAVIISGGWSNERLYWVRISEGKYLVAGFGDGKKMAVVSTGDVSGLLFDGNWHHLAAVLDRSRQGEVRLYLDGRRVDQSKVAFCGPIIYESETMGLVLGAIAPWYIGKEGYRGLIDEVRISNTVRPDYVVREPLPAEAVAGQPERKPFSYDPALSKTPLVLKPTETVIALHSGVVESGTNQAAALLQTWLRRACRVNSGFEILSEEKISETEGKTIIALGLSRWVEPEEVRDLWRDGFLIRRKAMVIIIAGGQSRGTYLGAVRFLDQVAGVRFYLPTDLFTSLPESSRITVGELNWREEPFARSAYLSGVKAIPGDSGWLEKVGGSRRVGGTHQHSMYQVFPPDRYAEKYPEVYPVIGGQRYIPGNSQDQGWQPCFSEPKTLQAARETVQRYFRTNPGDAYLAFSVMDSHRICECPKCTAFYEDFGKKNQASSREEAHSYLYWKFMNNLAEWMEKELPGKYLIGLAYGVTRFPPPFRLRPNIIVFANFHVAELEADGILKPGEDGLSPLDRWLNLASNFGNHDWYHGNGFVLPRIYSGYWSQFLTALQKKAKNVFMHAELYPNWGLDGPKGYILARLWQQPSLNVKVLLKQFCEDMFGPAAAPMEEYFTRLEHLWVVLDNKKGPERKLFQWSRQLLTDEEDRAEIKACRGLLDKAIALAVTEEQKKRVDLFSRTFRLTEYLIELNAATTVEKSRLEEIRKYVVENISNDPMTLYDSSVENVEKIIKAVTAGKKIIDR